MGVEMSYRRSRIATIVRNSTKFTPERPDRNQWLGIPGANDNTGRLGYRSYISKHLDKPKRSLAELQQMPALSALLTLLRQTVYDRYADEATMAV